LQVSTFWIGGSGVPEISAIFADSSGSLHCKFANSFNGAGSGVLPESAKIADSGILVGVVHFCNFYRFAPLMKSL